MIVMDYQKKYSKEITITDAFAYIQGTVLKKMVGNISFTHRRLEESDSYALMPIPKLRAL